MKGETIELLEELQCTTSIEANLAIIREINRITFLDRMKPLMEGVARELIKAGVDFSKAALPILALLIFPIFSFAQQSQPLQIVSNCIKGVYDACEFIPPHWYYLKNGIWTRDDGVVGKPLVVITGTCTVVAVNESEYWKHFNDVASESVKAGLQVGQGQDSLRDCKIPLNIAIKWRAKSYSDCYAAIGLPDECYRRADGAFEAKAAQLHMFEDCDKEVESAEKRFEIEEKDNSFPLGKIIVGGLRRLFRKK